MSRHQPGLAVFGPAHGKHMRLDDCLLITVTASLQITSQVPDEFVLSAITVVSILARLVLNRAHLT